MNKLMEKNAIRHAVIWIAIYVVLVNLGGMISEEVGIVDSVTSAFVVLLSLFLLKYLKENHWIEKFGLRKIAQEDMQKTFFYLPLVLLLLIQLLGGVKSDISITEVVVTCVMMMGVGFIEELIFRGFLMDAIWKKSGRNRAIVISGLAFGFGHIVNLFRGYGYVEQITQILVAGGIGIVLALLVASTKNIVPGILFHIVFNVMGTFSRPSETAQTAYSLILILVVCAGYSLYLLKSIKDIRTIPDEGNISV